MIEFLPDIELLPAAELPFVNAACVHCESGSFEGMFSDRAELIHP